MKLRAKVYQWFMNLIVQRNYERTKESLRKQQKNYKSTSNLSVSQWILKKVKSTNDK